MKKVKIDLMSTRELENLVAEIETELNTRKLKLEAIEELKIFAESKGIDLVDLMMEIGNHRGSILKPPSKVAVKYRDPSDPSKTWTGRGRTPLWISNEVSKGKNIEDFAV